MSVQSWTCACSRRVPANVDVCRCGMGRDQRVPARAGSAPGPTPTSSGGVVLKLAGFAALLVVAGVWFVRFGPVEKPRPVAAAASAPAPSTLPFQQPTPPPATPEAPSAPWPPPDEPTPEPRPRYEYVPRVRVSAPPGEGSEPGPSEMDQMKAKAEVLRRQYREAKRFVERLEREVAELEEKASRIGSIAVFTGPGLQVKDPKVRTDAEVTVERLPRARDELARAKQWLADVEEKARLDGVPSGQLY